MQNGYFQLVKAPGGFGVRLIPPVDGGEDINISELLHYLDGENIDCDIATLKKAIEEKKDQVSFLGVGECPVVNERYQLNVSADNMTATMRFYAPSETGARLELSEVINDLRYQNIVKGIQMQALQNHFMSKNDFCTDLIAAEGKEPRQGVDDRIDYYFNTDVQAKPEQREDGTVDYYNLNMINHCKKGEVLARIVRGESGEDGFNIIGRTLHPRELKRVKLKHGKNIQMSEDGLSISSMVDGHVTLVDNEVFVSDVYQVENVDTSTGNIEYTGSVQINGNVSSGFVVVADGNVIINGVVEGAQIRAGGDIVIARGVNGMSKGILKAGGNVISKFIENATVDAVGYVNTGSILHSNVTAGTEIEVTGKRGFITGGHVQAGRLINVKTLGALMGAPTVVEVGADPKVKAHYTELQKEVRELIKSIRADQTIMVGFADKRAKGVKFTEEQVKYVRELSKKIEKCKIELETKNNEMLRLYNMFGFKNKAKVVVRGEVHPGTTIVIGDLSTVIQNTYHYCRFEVAEGEVKSLPL